ncbi:MAG: carbohydrate kinase family protein [Evtepia gabavorous]
MAISDVLTPSEKELDALGGHEGGAAGPGWQNGVWKQGARGGVVQAPRERFSYEAEPCLSVDTTGAGDSFSGALLYALAQGGTLREGIVLAARCAAKTVELRGPHGFWKKRDGFSL